MLIECLFSMTPLPRHKRDKAAELGSPPRVLVGARPHWRVDENKHSPEMKYDLPSGLRRSGGGGKRGWRVARSGHDR